MQTLCIVVAAFYMLLEFLSMCSHIAKSDNAGEGCLYLLLGGAGIGGLIMVIHYIVTH